MNAIYEIIRTMSTEEQQRFLLFQKQKNKRTDTHNTKLFKLIASGNTKRISASKIYGIENKTAYNALKKRLLDSLLDFMAIEGFKNDASNEMELLKLLLTARILLKQQLYKPGFRLLEKITSKAVALELFGLAAEGYHTHIEYLHKDSTTNDRKAIIEKTRVNLNRLQETERLNIHFALLKSSLSENPQGQQQNSLSELLNRFFGNNTDLQKYFTYKTLFQLMDICNEYASLYQQFHAITPFMEKIYASIAEKEALSAHHLYYHIQVIYVMANLYFRNKDFDTSQLWVEKMAALMKQKNAKYEKRFLLKYGLLKSLNFHYTGRINDAIAVAENTLGAVKKPELSEQYNLLLALAMYYFHIADLKKTSAVLKTWNRSDSWHESRLGIEWTAKKNLFEIIFHVEMENREYALSRIKSFKRRYRPYLNNLANAYIFLKLVEMHIQNPENTATEAYISYAEKSIAWKEQNQEDIFVMNFYAWLKSKMTQTALPEVLNKLIFLT
jgi:hypothetical protein